MIDNMLYAIAHFLRDRLPFLWNWVDLLNSFFFVLRYGKKMKRIPVILQGYAKDYKILPMCECSMEELTSFFSKQPEDAYTFFRPHGFDTRSIKKLQRNKAFLAYIIYHKEGIVGYCFLRSFCHGKGFRGRMVDIHYRGHGLGTLMNKLMNDVGFSLGLRLFETVSKDNVASYRSALAASDVKVMEELPHNELYLEIVNQKK